MSELIPFLLNRTATELRSICARLGIYQRTTTTKSACAAAIADFWLHSPQRSDLLARLSSLARTALLRLLQFQSIPRPLFCAEFGDLRPARSAGPRDSLPWRTPHSACEELAYAGLLYGSDARPLHKTAAFLLPEQLHPFLQAALAAAPDAAPDARPPTPMPPFSPHSLVHDVAELLAAVHRCRQLDIPLRHGRWLPAAALRDLNTNLLHPDPLPLPRSPRRMTHLRYLSFWAAAGGLHNGGALSPAGWNWLDQPTDQQIAHLWQGWRTATEELRADFGWPDALLPDPWPDLLWQVLRSRQGTWTAGEIAAGLLADAPDAYWVANLDRTHTLDEIISDLCRGPLAHFGMVTWPADHASKDDLYELTRFGRDLLDDVPPALLAPPPVAPCTWSQEDDAIVIQRPAPWITHGIPVLAACAQQAALHSTDGTSHVYRITASTARRAAHGGLTAALLFDALATLGIDLPVEPSGQLRAWLEPAAYNNIDLVTLLRTPGSRAMADLHGIRAISVHLQSLISPSAAVLDLTPDAARRLLRQHGFGAPPPALGPVSQPADLEAELAASWLAGQLYSLLRRFLPLPLDPPYGMLEQAFGALPAPQQAVLTAWRDQLAQDLLDLIDGRSFTPPPEPSDPAQWRPLLQAAMETGQWLEMIYFSPARNLAVRRRIQPAWFRQEHGPACVLAYCQEAGAVLTFRLDRIQSLQPLADSA